MGCLGGRHVSPIISRQGHTHNRKREWEHLRSVGVADTQHLGLATYDASLEHSAGPELRQSKQGIARDSPQAAHHLILCEQAATEIEAKAMDGEKIKAVPIPVPSIFDFRRGFHPSANHISIVSTQTG